MRLTFTGYLLYALCWLFYVTKIIVLCIKVQVLHEKQCLIKSFVDIAIDDAYFNLTPALQKDFYSD